MDTIEQAALAAMQSGESFVSVCANVETLIDAGEDVSAVVGSLLLRWIEDGILAREYRLATV